MPAATTNTENKPRKPRVATDKAPAKATKPKAAAAPKAGKQNHVLTIEPDDRSTIPSWKVSRADGTVLGWFSTESTVNEKFEKAGDTRRLKHGKIVEVGE